MSKLEELARCAWRIRRYAVRMGEVQGQGYVGQALGYADVLAVAYGHALNLRPEDPEWPQRDRFLLSHGHYAIAHYAALIEAGVLPESELESYGSDDSRLPMSGMASYTPGMEISGGSLGQGLPIAVGIALGLRHHHVHRHGVGALAHQHGVIAQRRELVAARALQGVAHLVRLGEGQGEGGALDHPARGAQRVFQRGVHEHHGPVHGDHGHQRGQQVEGSEAGGGRVGGSVGGFQAAYFDAVRRDSSRLMPAISASLRAMAALSSATRSRYFW